MTNALRRRRPRGLTAAAVALASLAAALTTSSAPAGADQVDEAVAAAQAAIPAEAWGSVADLLPRTEAEATPRHFNDLTVAQQAIVLPSLCTQLSNGVVVFTCEEELDYATGLSAPFEIAYQAIEASNAIVADCNDIQTDCPVDPLV